MHNALCPQRSIHYLLTQFAHSDLIRRKLAKHMRPALVLWQISLMDMSRAVSRCLQTWTFGDVCKPLLCFSVPALSQCMLIVNAYRDLRNLPARKGRPILPVLYSLCLNITTPVIRISANATAPQSHQFCLTSFTTRRTGVPWLPGGPFAFMKSC